MSPKAPRLTAKQVIKRLKNAGFVEVSQTGFHLKLFNPQTRRTAIVPIHIDTPRAEDAGILKPSKTELLKALSKCLYQLL